jgi:hypothetical protein
MMFVHKICTFDLGECIEQKITMPQSREQYREIRSRPGHPEHAPHHLLRHVGRSLAMSSVFPRRTTSLSTFFCVQTVRHQWTLATPFSSASAVCSFQLLATQAHAQAPPEPKNHFACAVSSIRTEILSRSTKTMITSILAIGKGNGLELWRRASSGRLTFH